MFQPDPRSRYTVLTALRRRPQDKLPFRPLRVEDIPAIAPYLSQAQTRTCDFSIGGLLMWADYFSYSYAIYRDTLFIKGVAEDDVTRTAFSIPVGKMPLQDSVALLREYCEATGCLPLEFSAVPEVYVDPLRLLGARRVDPLDDWSDYLYEAPALASLTGKKLSKKRNHVNRFASDNPDYRFEPLTPAILPAVREFYHNSVMADGKPALAEIERVQVMNVLDRYSEYPFTGAVLSTGANGIVAFTIGEVIGDTLYVHIEKMNHGIAGAGETVNKLFAARMLEENPTLRYINREEAVGDPGLIHAKESYHPVMLLKKYNVIM